MTESKPADLAVSNATVDDLEGVLKLQYLGYQVEAQRYDAYQLDALTQSLASLREDLTATTMLVVRLPDGEVVGTVRGRRAGETVHVGRLVVHPRFQRHGLGGRLLSTLEQRCGSGVRFDVFTGHRSEEFLGLYERAGYRRYRADPINERLTLVHLEKPAQEQPVQNLSGEQPAQQQPAQQHLAGQQSTQQQSTQPGKRVPPAWT